MNTPVGILSIRLSQGRKIRSRALRVRGTEPTGFQMGRRL
jgi:hypothetical protein